MLQRNNLTVIRFTQQDTADVHATRSLLADALTEPSSRVLADLSVIGTIDGGLYAAMLIASREMPTDARFAVYAPEHVMDSLAEWRLEDTWPCFVDWGRATEYLCADHADA